MKAGEMTDEQIVGTFQEAEKCEKKVADIGREKGISANNFYVWKRKFGALQTSDVNQLREMERENARLKRLLAERDLDNDILSGSFQDSYSWLW
jgi:putative transposase